jgi:SNF2 family DNA or RNA helicase
MGTFADKAHPYQKKGLKFCLENPSSYLQLSMGLGKTLISLEWVKDKLDSGVLIIAPLRAISTTWPDEMEKWGYDYTYTVLHGPEKLHNIGLKRQVYIINFEGLQWLFDAMKTLFKVTKRLPFRTIIIDEGSMIKSPSTKRFKTLRKLVDVFHNKLILSGTPAPNSLLDLWSQYYFLDGGERLEKAYYKYRQMYFYPLDYKQFTWAIRSQEQKDMIYDKIKDITFRLDAGDYIKLPDRIDNVIKLRLSKTLQDNYKLLEKKFFLELEDTEIEVFNSAALSMKLRQYIQGGLYTNDKGAWEKVHEVKLNQLKEMVEIADGSPILCPIQFKFELELIRKVFPKVPAIVGGVPAQTTVQYIKDWNKKKIPLLICHPASLSHAVNMQYGGHTIVWYGLTWSSEQYQQLNARIDRQGQKHEVIVHHLVMQNTIDIAVMRALKSKIAGQRQLLDFIKDYHNADT